MSTQNESKKMDPRYNRVSGSAMKDQIPAHLPTKPQQYLKSASLCQFHKKIFILTGNRLNDHSAVNPNILNGNAQKLNKRKMSNK